MSQPTPLAIPQIRNLVRTAEAKADAALLAKVELMQGMLRVRQQGVDAAPHVGQAGIARLARAIQAEVAAQNDLFRTHNALTKAAHELWPELITSDIPHDTPEYTGEDLSEPVIGATAA
jgi:hypothetical protein